MAKNTFIFLMLVSRFSRIENKFVSKRFVENFIGLLLIFIQFYTEQIVVKLHIWGYLTLKSTYSVQYLLIIAKHDQLEIKNKMIVVIPQSIYS